MTVCGELYMSFVNFAKREVQLKVVYYGPGMCGKTTNIQMIHNMLNPDARGDLTSLATSGDRTLFFDFMPLEADAIEGFKTRFQLYTVPGQPMYNATRQLVLLSVDGVVFVADSQWSKMQENIESLANLEKNLAAKGNSLDTIPYVLQYNKRDLPGAAPLHYLDYTLNNRPMRTPSIAAVATTGSGVFETLNMISRLVLNKFVKAHSGSDNSNKQIKLV